MITPGNIPFKKAINQITRKTSESKAFPRFKLLLAEDIRSFRDKGLAVDEKEVERILIECLEVYREKGFEPGEVQYFKRLYNAQPGCGPRKKSGKSKKIICMPVYGSKMVKAVSQSG